MANIDGLTINNVTYDFTLSVSTELVLRHLDILPTGTTVSSNVNWVNFNGEGFLIHDGTNNKSLGLFFPAVSTTSNENKVIATTDNGTLSVNGTAYKLDSTSKPSIYAPTSSISTTNNQRYLLGSSSTTSISTTNTNGSCYMQSGVLYSNGRKCTSVMAGTASSSSGNTAQKTGLRLGFTNSTLYIWVE